MRALTGEGVGSTLDDVRRRNLAQVLRLVHHRGPVSRSEITKATGLNRSTVGALVADLDDRGLVVETHAVPTKRIGRPSPMVNASPTTVAIAVNPEIDATEVAVVTLGGRVLRRVRHKHERIPTPGEFVNTVTAIIAGMRPELDAGFRTLGIGVAVPGLVRGDDSVVVLAPHLGWRDAEVARLLSEATGFPVSAANDANVGVGAEAAFGAGRDLDSIVYLNGGASGIGGAIAVGGTLLGGHAGHSGEFGHTLVESQGTPCHCGAVGCLETEVRRDRLLDSVGLDSSRVGELTGALIAAWGSRGSPGGAELRRQLDYFGVALRGIVNGLNPHCVVLGGFLGTIWKVVGEAEIKRSIGETLPGGLEDLTLRHAALGDEILLVGAAELVFRPVIEDPTLVPVVAAESP
ncbi:ROK family transcriptional regulator [Agromyces sp. NPDC055520]